MAPHTQYKVFSAKLTANFETEFLTAASDGWKPILLTSAAPATTIPQGTVVVVAILEKQG